MNGVAKDRNKQSFSCETLFTKVYHIFYEKRHLQPESVLVGYIFFGTYKLYCKLKFAVIFYDFFFLIKYITTSDAINNTRQIIPIVCALSAYIAYESARGFMTLNEIRSSLPAKRALRSFIKE